MENIQIISEGIQNNLRKVKSYDAKNRVVLFVLLSE